MQSAVVLEVIKNRSGIQAKETLLERYRSLLLKEAIIDGVFDEDLYQELCVTLLDCIRKFRIYTVKEKDEGSINTRLSSLSP